MQKSNDEVTTSLTFSAAFIHFHPLQPLSSSHLLSKKLGSVALQSFTKAMKIQDLIQDHLGSSREIHWIHDSEAGSARQVLHQAGKIHCQGWCQWYQWYQRRQWWKFLYVVVLLIRLLAAWLSASTCQSVDTRSAKRLAGPGRAPAVDLPSKKASMPADRRWLWRDWWLNHDPLASSYIMEYITRYQDGIVIV